MTHSTNGTDHLQEPALRYARQDVPIIRDSVTLEEALNIIRREGVGERIIYFYIINEEGQLELYNHGADFVFIPRMHASAQMAQIIDSVLREGLGTERADQIAHLRMRHEVIA
jgi:Mg/Co/Ni transporter MgtE